MKHKLTEEQGARFLALYYAPQHESYTTADHTVSAVMALAEECGWLQPQVTPEELANIRAYELSKAYNEAELRITLRRLFPETEEEAKCRVKREFVDSLGAVELVKFLNLFALGITAEDLR